MTYGHASNLLNPVANLYERIDFIFVGNTGQGTGRHPIGPVYAEVIGEEQSDRTPSGLWPSPNARLITFLHIASTMQLADN